MTRVASLYVAAGVIACGGKKDDKQEPAPAPKTTPDPKSGADKTPPPKDTKASTSGSGAKTEVASNANEKRCKDLLVKSWLKACDARRRQARVTREGRESDHRQALRTRVDVRDLALQEGVIDRRSRTALFGAGFDHPATIRVISG